MPQVWITLDTMEKPQERYRDQLLFYLMRDGKDYDLVRACSRERRACIAGFLEYLMETYSAGPDGCTYSDDMLKAYEIWYVA